VIEDQVRYRLPAEVIEAVRSAAAMERVSPATIVERAIRMYLGPAQEIADAARMVRNNLVNFAEIKDLLNVIADQSVDKSLLIDQLTAENESLSATASRR